MKLSRMLRGAILEVVPRHRASRHASLIASPSHTMADDGAQRAAVMAAAAAAVTQFQTMAHAYMLDDDDDDGLGGGGGGGGLDGMGDWMDGEEEDGEQPKQTRQSYPRPEYMGPRPNLSQNRPSPYIMSASSSIGRGGALRETDRSRAMFSCCRWCDVAAVESTRECCLSVCRVLCSQRASRFVSKNKHPPPTESLPESGTKKNEKHFFIFPHSDVQQDLQPTAFIKSLEKKLWNSRASISIGLYFFSFSLK